MPNSSSCRHRGTAEMPSGARAAHSGRSATGPVPNLCFAGPGSRLPSILARGLPLLLALAACSPADSDGEASAPAGGRKIAAAPAPPAAAVLQETELARGFAHPTSLLVLPDGSLLVAERAGGLRRIGRSGFVSTPLAGLPPVSAPGGLLDLALSPQFAVDGLLFFSYMEPREDGSTGLTVARATLEPLALLDLQVVYRQQPGLQATVDAGGRLAFDGSGNLFIGGGARTLVPALDPAGATGSELLRIEASGKVPRDNPFAARGDGRAEVWSYGHGSIQGLAVDPRTGKLWLAENWSRGGDALTLPQAGFNYGPPPLAPPPLAPGLESPSPAVDAPAQDRQAPDHPHYRWDAPQGLSGMAFYTGRPGAPWNDSLLLGSQTRRELIRLSLQGDRVVAEERLLGDRDRPIADVTVGSGDEIFVLTGDADGRLLLLAPPAAP